MLVRLSPREGDGGCCVLVLVLVLLRLFTTNKPEDRDSDGIILRVFFSEDTLLLLFLLAGGFDNFPFEKKILFDEEKHLTSHAAQSDVKPSHTRRKKKGAENDSSRNSRGRI